MPEISKMGYARCDIKKKGDNGQIVPEGWSAPSDISSGKVISFHVNYTWNGKEMKMMMKRLQSWNPAGETARSDKRM